MPVTAAGGPAPALPPVRPVPVRDAETLARPNFPGLARRPRIPGA
jgi:hypothetical protein